MTENLSAILKIVDCQANACDISAGLSIEYSGTGSVLLFPLCQVVVEMYMACSES